MSPIRLYAEMILGGICLGVILILWTELTLARDHIETLEVIEKANASIHKFQLDTAHHAHDTELGSLRAGLAAASHPVRLCRNTVQAPATAGTAPSSPAGDVRPVLERDPSPRGDAGPDISGLLRLFAFQGDACEADLREQQAVQ